MKIQTGVLLSLCGLCAVRVSAKVPLPNIFGGQKAPRREMPVPVWGRADPGEKVAVSFAGRPKSVVAGKDGKWMVRLDPLKATDLKTRDGKAPTWFELCGPDGIFKPAGAKIDGGNIEFCGGNYAPETRLHLPFASEEKYDFEDQLSHSFGDCGCLQTHSRNDRMTLWAYNGFNKSKACDIGIGNSPAARGNSDYTFAANGPPACAAHRLTILVK